MRRLRCFQPDRFHDVTVRCFRSEFRLLPTEDRVELLIYALAKAQEKFPGLVILAVCQMSNHLHLVVWDRQGQLSQFMHAFLSPYARRLNKIDRVRGAVFDRRFTALPIVDANALIKRIAYAVTNPVDAGLVPAWKGWQGLIGWFGDSPPRTATYFHEYRYRQAVEAAATAKDAEIKREDFEESATLTLGAWPGLDMDAVGAAIAQREEELRRQHRRFKGMQHVLRRSPLYRPKWTKLGGAPLCLWTCRRAKNRFLQEWFAFVAAYRRASAKFRSGDLTVDFPPFSCRPPSAVR